MNQWKTLIVAPGRILSLKEEYQNANCIAYVELSEVNEKIAAIRNGAKRNITAGCTCSACTYLREME